MLPAPEPHGASIPSMPQQGPPWLFDSQVQNQLCLAREKEKETKNKTLSALVTVNYSFQKHNIERISHISWQGDFVVAFENG